MGASKWVERLDVRSIRFLEGLSWLDLPYR
jgi:hypothetical protein